MSVQIEACVSNCVNYSMQQNKLPMITQLKLLSDEDLNDVVLNVRLDSDLADPLTINIERLVANEYCIFEKPVFGISGNKLANFTEKLEIVLKISVSTADGQELATNNYPVSILAFDEWTGTYRSPELICSFIMPNSPVIAPILKRASQILEEISNTTSFLGYLDGNPDFVKKQAAAIYMAIQELGITYRVLPASFEEFGQRVKNVDYVINNKFGNCIEMTCLYCSCLEAIGINTGIVFLEGHAMAAIWTINESFADVVSDEAERISKRAANGINQLILVETTLMCSNEQPSFDVSIISAQQQMLEKNFVLFVDVHRARIIGIRPLPQKVTNSDGGISLIEDTRIEAEIRKPADIVTIKALEKMKNEGILSRDKIWENKLLDLSLGNRLLNITLRSGTLPIALFDLASFEDKLSAGESFRIRGYIADKAEQNADNQYIVDFENQKILIQELFDSHVMHSFLTTDEQLPILERICRESKISAEENGSNSLFLALGLLKWYETPNSPKAHFAPILLLPVDLTRKTASSDFILSGREEETCINYTLVEMLKQSFDIDLSSLYELPLDESGVDVDKVLATIRHAIMDIPKWDVVEQSLLGNFSFRKYVMWKDLHNNSEILKNSVIYKSLINGCYQSTTSSDLLYSRSSIDERVSCGSLFLPMSSDSSQLEAVYLADQGESFILQGPPGTGKSQTITNIIANSIAKGKKVLFVAEKMAALSVVQNRLDNLGLTSHCLELHSNKTRKSVVLEKLGEIVDLEPWDENEDFNFISNSLQEKRDELNFLVDAIHSPYIAKMSLYDALNMVLDLGVNVKTRFTEEVVKSLNAESIYQAENAARDFSLVASSIVNVDNHPLKEICATDIHAELRGETFEYANERFDKIIENLNDGVEKLGSIFNIKEWLNNYKNFKKTINLLELICRLTFLNSKILAKENCAEFIKELELIINNSLFIKANTFNLGEHAEELFVLDLDEIKQSWEADEQKFIVLRMLGHAKHVKMFDKILAGDPQVSSDNFSKLLKYAMTAKEMLHKTKTQLQIVTEVDSSYASLILENPNKAATILKDCKSLIDILNKFEDQEISNSLLHVIAKCLDVDGNKFLDDLFDLVKSYKTANSSFDLTNKELQDYLHFDEDLAPKDFIGYNQMLKRWAANFSSLKVWTQYNRSLKIITDSGFKSFTDLLRRGIIPAKDAPQYLTSMIGCSYIDYIVEKIPALQSFNGLVFSDKIKRFKDLLMKYRDLTCKIIRTNLHNNGIKAMQNSAFAEQFNYLKRAIKSRGRKLSLRSIFDEISDILPELFPCMLMSPLSVAQYLNPEKYNFDLIVFDEASQMLTAEAVGAIGRGKQVIVVGDPKQLPPTDFFNVKNTEDDLINDDLESILDDCESLNMPMKLLSWHYRSHHESLIAFSNNSYYGGKLMTFPSPNDQETMVKFVPVDGVYERGGSGCNKKESEEVVNFISDFLQMTKESQNFYSLGVVAFNAKQQTQIENDLTKFYRANPELEEIALSLPEPIFIKNLENVQGDERDLIVFSVGFGKDKAGKLSMNFGPINRVGGERRLNVAVTRARYEMFVFSSMDPSDMRIDNTSPEGVIGLYNFLSYAKLGKKFLAKANGNTYHKQEALHKDIAKELAKNGYDCDIDIGASGYRVDLAIKDPNCPEKYIACIITDGYSYRNARSAYDRNLGQCAVLKSLGWKVIRLWSVDWWQNKEGILNNLLQEIHDSES